MNLITIFFFKMLWNWNLEFWESYFTLTCHLRPCQLKTLKRFDEDFSIMMIGSYFLTFLINCLHIKVCKTIFHIFTLIEIKLITIFLWYCFPRTSKVGKCTVLQLWTSKCVTYEIEIWHLLIFFAKSRLVTMHTFHNKCLESKLCLEKWILTIEI